MADSSSFPVTVTVTVLASVTVIVPPQEPPEPVSAASEAVADG